MLVPDWYRRFIRGASRGCKVRFSQGVIIDPAVDAEAGATCGSKCGSAEEVSFGATRSRRNRRHRARQNSGRLGGRSSDEARSEWTEQSGNSNRATGWHGTPRRLGTEVSRDRRMSIWGDSEADRRRYRGREAKGQPGAFTTGTAERERAEATRRSITGKAGGTERGAT